MAAFTAQPPLTKLMIPAVGRAWIERSRLHKTLDYLVMYPLTLICAPAGSGKTTLVTGWYQERQISLVWVSLDEDDNDLAPLALSVATALNTITPGILPSVKHLLDSSEQMLDALSLARQIIHHTASVDDHFVLVLDDYHRITDPQIHKMLDYLIERMPPCMHLILNTRVDPPLQLGRLRVRDQIIEIRENDLRFNLDEAASFLQDGFHLDLTQSQLEALDQRIEGWAAGLKLAALALRNRPDTAQFIESFTGSHRFIVDYLLEEVFERQPPEMQRFLLETSILREMNASLCAAVSGLDNAQSLLEQLVRLNLFTVRLDPEHRWFRYHHLFADVLQHRLLSQGASTVTTLHQRAACWYETMHLPHNAISHYFQAKDYAGAAAYLDTLTIKDIERIGALQFLHWIDALPDSTLTAYPNLLITAAHFDLSFHSTSSNYASTARAALQQNPNPHLQARLMVVESRQILNRREQIDPCLDLMDAALPPLEHDPVWYAMALHHLARVHMALNDMVSAQRILEKIIRTADGKDDLPVLFRASQDLGLMLLRETKLNAANHYLQLAISVAERHGETEHPMMCALYLAMYYSAALRAEPDEAMGYLDAVIRLAERVENISYLAQGYMGQSFMHLYRGDHQAVWAALKQYDRLVQQYPDIDDGSSLAQRVVIFLELGDYESAKQWALTSELTFDPNQPLTILGMTSLLVLCCVALAGLARNDPVASWEEVTRLLERLYHHANQLNQISWKLNALACLAEAYMLKGHDTKALDFLEEGFHIAEGENYASAFGASAMIPLLEMYNHQRRPTAFSQRVLALARQSAGITETQTATSSTDHMGIEELTGREMEILRLVQQGQSNNDIAQTLYVSLATVKRHLANVFLKLGADNRTHALALAREYGFI